MRQILRSEQGQAMTEFLIALPVISLFFGAIFYFGYGMNQKIENTMAVHLAAFVYNSDKGRTPSDTWTINQGQVQTAFFTRGKTVQLTAENWNTPRAQYAAFATDTFNTPRSSYGGGASWNPNTAAGAYLATQSPAGAHARTQTTITAAGTGWPQVPGISNKTIQANLYVDQSTRKLEGMSFNLPSNFPPSSWSLGYLPIMGAYIAGWDWDFAQNTLSGGMGKPQDDTTWP